MMGLDELVACIKTIQKRVRENGNFLQKNETRTRMVLIDPLLSALGWDITNPGVVQAEFEVGGKLADYALLGQDGKPVMVLEAKRLGAKLDTHLWQMINYANMAGIQYAGITDGDHWEIYKVFEQSKLEDRRKLKISIVGTPVYESALQLLLLWNSNLGSTQPIQANVPLLIRKGATGVKETKIAKPSTSSGWVPLSDFKGNPVWHVLVLSGSGTAASENSNSGMRYYAPWWRSYMPKK